MTNRTPTAEEVLGLYLKWNKTGDDFNEFRMQCRAMDVINDKEKFEAALVAWQAAQGPVTREWFVERFGSDRYEIRRNVWLEMFPCDGNIWLITHLSSHFHNSELHNPTRSDIETLVRLFSGKDGE